MDERNLQQMSVEVDGKLYPVETYAQASAMVLDALEKYGGYFRDLPVIGIYEGGRKTGHVSSNGKVWLRRGGHDYQVWPPRTDPALLTISQPPPGTVAAALAAKDISGDDQRGDHAPTCGAADGQSVRQCRARAGSIRQPRRATR